MEDRREDRRDDETEHAGSDARQVKCCIASPDFSVLAGVGHGRGEQYQHQSRDVPDLSWEGLEGVAMKRGEGIYNGN